MKKKLIGYCVEQRYYWNIKGNWTTSGWGIQYNNKIYKSKEVAQEAVDNYCYSSNKQYRIKPLYQLSGDEEEVIPAMKYALRGKLLNYVDNPYVTYSLHNSYEEANKELEKYLDRTDIEFEIEEIIL